MSRRLRRLIALAVLLGVGGTYAITRLHARRSPYRLSGTVEARTISVGSRVGGRIERVLAREGDQVEPGQPLLELEAGELHAQRQQAEGQLAQASATLELMKEGAREEELAQARARLRAATASVRKAQRDAERSRVLARAGAIPRSTLDEVETSLEGARAQWKQAAAALEQLERGARPAQLRAQEGLVTAATGLLEAAQVALDELTIRAPRRAIVEALELRPGDILAPNATAVTLLEESGLYLRIYVPETLLGLLRVGDRVPIEIEALPRESFAGVVEHINEVGEYTPRNLQSADERANQVFAARVRPEQRQEQLRAGMAASIVVPRRGATMNATGARR